VKINAPLRENGSTTFFFNPFLPFERRLFYKHSLSERILTTTNSVIPCRRPYLSEMSGEGVLKDMELVCMRRGADFELPCTPLTLATVQLTRRLLDADPHKYCANGFITSEI